MKRPGSVGPVVGVELSEGLAYVGALHAELLHEGGLQRIHARDDFSAQH